MLPAEVEAARIEWAGTVTQRHLKLLMENRSFQDIVSQKLVAFGYIGPVFSGISAITDTIEDLIVALTVEAIIDEHVANFTIHVNTKGFEISFP